MRPASARSCSFCRRSCSRFLPVESVLPFSSNSEAAFPTAGICSPLDGIGPGEIGLDLLDGRLGEGSIREVILATNPNVEGEATAVYLTRLLKPLGLHVTRLAQGLPAGGDLEYTDDLTLQRALEGRRDY